MPNVQGIELVEGDVNALCESLLHDAPGLRAPIEFGVLRHALIEPAWDTIVVKTNKFAKDNVGQLMRQGLLQEGRHLQVAVDRAPRVVDKTAGPGWGARRLSVGLAVQIQVDLTAFVPEPGDLITLHNVREAKIETNLVVIGFGVLEYCYGKRRVLLVEDAEVGAGFFLPG